MSQSVTPSTAFTDTQYNSVALDEPQDRVSASAPAPNAASGAGQENNEAGRRYLARLPEASVTLKEGMSNFGSYVVGIPLVTATYAALAVSFYIFYVLGLWDTTTWLGLDWTGLKYGQVWRIWTYPLTHFGILHILFNVLAFVPLSMAHERHVGSFHHLYTLLVFFSLLPALIFIIVSATTWGWVATILHSTLYGGLSGLWFALLVWESRELAGRERSFFGLLTIPSHFYPLFLLAVVQLLIPSSSIWGHLIGMAIGYLYAFTPVLRYFVIPDAKVERLEEVKLLQPIVKRHGFVRVKDASRGGWFLPLYGHSESWADLLNTTSQPPAGQAQAQGLAQARANTLSSSSFQSLESVYTSPSTSGTVEPFSGQGHKLGS